MSSRWDDLDRIAVTGITARGFHGVLEHEKREGQTFVVDVALGVDTRAAAATDDLARTVDYSAVAADVVAIVSDGSLDLIETLAAAHRRRLPGPRPASRRSRSSCTSRRRPSACRSTTSP